MAVVWNLAFFKTLGEASVSAGAATFASAWGVNGKFDLHDLYVALGAAGVIVLYTFAKGLGVSQAVSSGKVITVGDGLEYWDFEPTAPQVQEAVQSPYAV